ncbi:hypothetical protein [Streptomyces sp. H27-C3]|uniref:hypothetical protein n=1 Tax=Streptomyces sp. H27-C3 TaxID=3046305 RepID=UPI0024B8AC99|nr:hypothetical protein [Streptomyces sp. H27-C3]MDJ0464595.1 hypothetical protein [Streptomyces sp. H27-C3]
MTTLWLPLTVTALAVALTYVCCIRPMRKQGGSCPAPPQRTSHSVDEEIRLKREELRLLRERAAMQARRRER